MSAPSSKKMGFVGLGNMGQSMAKRLLDTGFPLTVWNRTVAKTADLTRLGATVAGSPKELASKSQIIIIMTYDDAALEAVAVGDNGVLAGAKAGTIIISMSTVSPKISSYIAGLAEKRGVKMLRAPVSGSTNWAAEGKLTILTSGEKEVYENCQEVLHALGQKIVYLGIGDKALYMKLALQIVLGVTSQALAEAITLGEKAGLDWNQMLDIMGNSVITSPAVTRALPRLMERKFMGFGTVSMLSKDFDSALAAGRELGSSMPMTALVRQFFSTLDATGRGQMNDSALVLLMEELSGVAH